MYFDDIHQPPPNSFQVCLLFLFISPDKVQFVLSIFSRLCSHPLKHLHPSKENQTFLSKQLSAASSPSARAGGLDCILRGKDSHPIIKWVVAPLLLVPLLHQWMHLATNHYFSLQGSFLDKTDHYLSSPAVHSSSLPSFWKRASRAETSRSVPACILPCL